MTDYAHPEEQARALQVGCDGYPPKPLDTRGLVHTVARVLGH